jgi:hypothetical protein
MLDRATVFAMRVLRAWRYYRRLHYSWRLSWAKAGWSLGEL